jgi:hypothetical protein
MTTTATITKTITEPIQGTDELVETETYSIPEKGKEKVAKLTKTLPISDDELVLIERYRELSKLIAPYEVEKEAIKELISESMKSRNAKALTRNGVTEVALVPTSRTNADAKGLFAAFPKIASMFLSITHSVRFDAKK